MARRTSSILLIGLLVLTASLVLLLVRGADLSGERRTALEAWSGVERTYQQRAELVPQIVAVLRSVDRSQEALMLRVEQAQAEVLSLRPNPQATLELDAFRRFMATQDRLSVALGQVLDTLYQLPHRAEARVQTATGELEVSESRIVVARSDYVRAAERYNAKLSSVPVRLMSITRGAPGEALIASFEAAKAP
jgi:LemA protein